MSYYPPVGASYIAMHCINIKIQLLIVDVALLLLGKLTSSLCNWNLTVLYMFMLKLSCDHIGTILLT